MGKKTLNLLGFETIYIWNMGVGGGGEDEDHLG